MLRAIELGAFAAHTGAIVKVGPQRLRRRIGDYSENRGGAFRGNGIADPTVRAARAGIEQIVRAHLTVRRKQIAACLRLRRPFRRQLVGRQHLDARAALPALFAFRLKKHFASFRYFPSREADY